jgi:hypothetical protein
VPIDPGEHALEVRAPKKTPYTQSITIARGPGVEQIAIPALADEGAGGADRSVAQPPSDLGAPEPKTPVTRWVGLGVGVAGLALLTVGVVELLAASSHKSDSDAFAAKGDKANSDAAYSDATSAQTLGFVFAGAGIVAAGVGGYLFATSFGGSSKPKAGSVQLVPLVGAHAGGLSAVGTF